MSVLSEALLAEIRERAAVYDRDNSFFHEDLEALRAVGYLNPRPLSEMVSDQRTLAAHAPATALALGMHFTWMGVAQTLAQSGDSTLQHVLDGARSGELYAFGISERGNDRVMTDSITSVTKVEAATDSKAKKSSPRSLPPGPSLACWGEWVTRSSTALLIVQLRASASLKTGTP